MNRCWWLFRWFQELFNSFWWITHIQAILWVTSVLTESCCPVKMLTFDFLLGPDELFWFPFNFFYIFYQCQNQLHKFTFHIYKTYTNHLSIPYSRSQIIDFPSLTSRSSSRPLTAHLLRTNPSLHSSQVFPRCSLVMYLDVTVLMLTPFWITFPFLNDSPTLLHPEIT